MAEHNVTPSMPGAASAGTDRASATGQHGGASNLSDKASEAAAQLKQSASEAASRLRQSASEAASQVHERVTDTYGSLHERGSRHYDDLRDGGAERFARGQDAAERFISENPVLVGVVGLAAGLLIGALLPRTRQEDRTVGAWSDEVRDQGLRYARDVTERGRHFVEQAMDQAQETASAAANAAADEVKKGAGGKPHEGGKPQEGGAQPERGGANQNQGGPASPGGPASSGGSPGGPPRTH